MKDQSTKKRVVIADGQAAVRDLLATLLGKDFALEIAGQTDSGLDALRLCRKVRPELLILDSQLRELCGAELLRKVRDELPSIRTLVFNGSSEAGAVVQMLRAKPNGLVLKSEPLEKLRKAIAAVLDGSSYFTSCAAPFLFASLTHATAELELSPRQREILQLIAEGSSTKEISSRLTVSIKTVENHRANLMFRLGLHKVADLTRYAVREGIIQP